MPNIERRNHLFCAVLIVPKDVRETLGRSKFRQSLNTANALEAERLAAPYIAKWKAEIAQARGNSNAVVDEGRRWQRAFSAQEGLIMEGVPGSEEGHEVLVETLIEETKNVETRHGREAADDYWGVATSTRTRSDILFEQWAAQLDVIAKTKEQRVKDVQKLITKFPTLEGITNKAVHTWAWGCIESGINTESSMVRVLKSSRSYWRYLQKARKVEPDHNPLEVPEISPKRSGRGSKKTANLPYAPEDVALLYKTALVGWGKRPKADEQLAALIKIGAYTGARIEELCALKVADVGAWSFKVIDAKSDAGHREVPIHSAIHDLIAKMRKESADGYLFEGLTFNKFGDRSNAIGKRFGRLKKHLRFGEERTFHSLRATLATQMENAGVPEGVAADILGHEKQTMTYGLYSGGNALEIKREAIEKVTFPFTD